MAPVPANALVIHNRSTNDWDIAVGARQYSESLRLQASCSLVSPTYPFNLSAHSQASSFRLQITSRDLKRAKRTPVSLHVSSASSSPTSVQVFLRRTSTGHELVILDLHDPANWMSQIPDDRSVPAIHIPGTHESCAFYGGFIAKCQSGISLYDQLCGGIRFIDLRFSVKHGQLLAYHGPLPMHATAEELLSQLYRFLVDHPKECVITSIKQEDSDPQFVELLAELIMREEKKWYLADAFPLLCGVRGKAVLLSRFKSIPQIGLHPLQWPYNLPAVFDYEIAQVSVQTQDWCEVSVLQIPEKFALVSQLLLSPISRLTFKLNFATGATFILGMPWLIAKGFGLPWLGIRGVNTRVLDLMLELKVEGKQVAPCCILFDFVEFPHGLVDVCVGMNFF